MAEIAILALVLLGVAGVLWIRERNRRRTHPVLGGPNDAIRIAHDAPFELYSNSFSHCSRKVRLALAELGVAYKHHPIELIETGWYQTISRDYLRVNPSGLVPTLVHEGRPVYESDAILTYAQAEAGPTAPRLVPDDPEERAEMARWIEFGAISSADAMHGMDKRAGPCIPGLTLPIFLAAIRYIPLQNILEGFLFHPDRRRPLFFTIGKLLGLRRTLSLPPVRAIAEPSARHMARHLAEIEKTLEARGGPWILGAAYSLADITLGCILLRLEETGWLEIFAAEQDLPALKAYYKRLKARPSWTAAISETPNPIIEKAKQDLAAARSDQRLQRSIYQH